MTALRRLLDVVAGWRADTGPARPHRFEAIFATTFTFDPDFFVHTGVLSALAGLGTERSSPANLVRQRLGAPRVGVLLGGPSQGATPPWVDQAVWDSARLGLLHAKCLVAIGDQRIDCLLTSANLTDVSWRTNREGVVTLSCRRDGAGDDAPHVARVLDGLATLADWRGLEQWPDLLRMVLGPLPTAGGSSGEIVWTGRPWPGSLPERLPRGSAVTAVSPFWPPEPAAADLVIQALSGLAPKIRLIMRGTEDGALFDAPPAFAKASAGLYPPVEIGIAPWTDDDTPVPRGQPARKRPLHAKQITVHTTGGPVSYVGSANMTVRGLSLDGSGNIELGVIVPVGVLIDPLRFDEIDLARCRDSLLDDEAIDPETFVSGLAVLDANRRLEVKLDPGPTAWDTVQIPAGEPGRPLPALEFALSLDSDTFGRVAATPEIAFGSGDLTGRLPVLLEDDVKLDAGTAASEEGFDSFLLGFGGRVEPDEADEGEEGAPAEVLPDGPPGSDSPADVRPVHRARDAIERLQAHEQALVARVSDDPGVPAALFELWLRGPAGVVGLARRLRRAALDESPPPVTATAAAFILMEIDELLRRLEGKAADLEPPRPQLKPPVAAARRLVRADFDAVAAILDRTVRRDIDRLRQQRSRS